MLLRISYSGNYAGIHVLDASLNVSYSKASFKLDVVSAVMSRQLTLFGKVVASRKVYGKPTNNYEQFVDAFVTDERHYITHKVCKISFMYMCISNVLILKYTLLFLRPQTPVFWHQKTAICVQMGEGEGVTPM